MLEDGGRRDTEFFGADEGHTADIMGIQIRIVLPP